MASIKISPQSRGLLYVGLSGFLFGSLGYFGTHALDSGLRLDFMLCWRFFIGIACLVFYKLAFHPRSRSASDVSVFSRAVLRSFLFGVFLYAPSTLAYFVSSSYIGTGLAMVVFFSFPGMVVLLNSWGGKRLPRPKTVLCLLGLGIGVCLLSVGLDVSFDPVGIAVGLFSAFFYALFIFLSKGRSSQLTSLQTTFCVTAGCTFSFAIASLFALATSTDVGQFVFFPPDFQAWMSVIACSILSTILPILLLLKGLETTSSEKASFLSVLEPVTTLGIGTLFMNEVISSWQFGGILLVLVSALTA